ncbi:hypothetical protein CRP143_gp31 [Roseobacter phage CRP-143]|nr:hypothetical protein CRP143_gp31 [Roseobacter phage CRP-143]
MGGSVGKILGAVAAVALAPVTGGMSLAAGLAGAAAGEALIDAPARKAESAQQQAQARADQAKADALAAASAKRTEMAQGAGVVARKGSATVGEQDKKDVRATVRKRAQGAGKLRIDPLATTTAAGGAATTGEAGLKTN